VACVPAEGVVKHSLTREIPRRRLDGLLAAYGQEVARRRGRSLAVLAVFAALVCVASWFGEVAPATLADHLSALTSYFSRILPPLSVANFAGDVAEWYWNLSGWLKLLFDTVLIAYLATLVATGTAGLLAFLAAANLAPGSVTRWCIKRLFEFCRTVPDLVFALMFVAAFGLGPLAGVLAIGIHSFGALGKLFTEVIENIDPNPVEGVRGCGGAFPAGVRFAALPQVLPNLASYALLRFEINVRASSIIGFVGAGGIGQELFVAIRKFYYTDVSAILLLIIITVALIDVITEHIRHGLNPAETTA
jgi:phosphonate transport system permease protein